MIGGKAAATYRFIRGFYGLTVKPTEFQKAMNTELSNLANTYVYLDDILILTNGTKDNQYNVVKQLLGTLNKAIVRQI